MTNPIAHLETRLRPIRWQDCSDRDLQLLQVHGKDQYTRLEATHEMQRRELELAKEMNEGIHAN